MAKTSYSAILRKAQEAGTRRDYASAESLLMGIVAETESLPEAWLFLGRARYALGDHDRALSALSTYLSCRPEDSSGWFFAGRTYLALGRSREACSCLRTSIDKGRNNAEAWALLGFAELRLKRSSKAVASLETAVGLAPDDKRIFRAYLNSLCVHAIRMLSRGNAHEAAAMLGFVIANGLDGPAQRLYRARALRSDGLIPEAIAEMDAAIAASPDDASLRLQAATLRFAAGDTEGAMNDIQRSGTTLPGQQGSTWTADAIDRWRALVALREGDYKTALEAALNRIRHGETDAAIRAVAAQANYELKRFDRAVEHYRRAVEADPDSPDLRMGLALSLWELHDYSGARKAAKSAAVRGAPDSETLYIETICDSRTGVDPALILPKTQSLIKARPGDPRLMLTLGECLYKTGRPDLADGWFADVLVVLPNHELSMLYRISIAESLALDSPAIERYGEYLAVYPDNNAVRKDYIDLLVRTRSWRQAAEAIEEGNAYGSSKGFDGILAVCYRNAGRYREAAALYRTQLKGDPKNVDLLLGLAYSLYKSGSKEASIELLERGAAFIGRNTEPYLALGVLRARQGDAEKAAAAFLKASELAPADPRPLRNLARLYTKAGIAETAAHFEERATMLESGISSPLINKKG